MANSAAIPALIAAFFFGILFNAASAALVLYVRGHGSAIFRDGLRLVLILFLLSSTIWALVEFLATLIDPTAASTCQVAVIFSSLFDQLGRTFVEQYLVWAVRRNGEKTAFSLLPQILVLGRLIVGIAFVGLTRAEFNPTCVPVSGVPGVPIAVIVIDAVILILLAVHALSKGSVKNTQDYQQVSGGGRAVGLVIIGLAIWMGTSVTLLLGISTIALFFRTTLPAIGLLILVAFVLLFFQTLVLSRQAPRRPDSPTSQGIQVQGSRDLSSSNSTDYPPSRYEDLKEVGTMSTTAFAAMGDAHQDYRINDDVNLPNISNPVTGVSGVGGLPIQGQLFPPARLSLAELSSLSAVPLPPSDWSNKRSKDGSNRPKVIPKGKGGKIQISHPIVQNSDEDTQNPLNRIPTVDLATAANNERERRAKHAQRVSAFIAQRPAPRAPSPPGRTDAIQRAKSTMRKDVNDLERSESTKTSQSAAGLSVEANASSTATQPSPGAEGVRRRSPRQPQPAPMTSKFQVIRPGEPLRIPILRAPETPQPASPTSPEPVKTPLQRRPTTGLPSNPRAQAAKAMAKEARNQKQQTVMFINNIVYDDPNIVSDIVQDASSKTPLTALESSNSVLHRPRPIPRKSDDDRQVFPVESSPHNAHRRSRSGVSITRRKSGILQSLPGSPTQLPSQPPLPKTAGTTARPLPNDTKSMTFDEKMNFLYTSVPLSAPSTTSNVTDRQSIPQMPPLPATFFDEQPTQTEAFSESEFRHDVRASKTTDRSTIRTASILGVTEIPERLTSNRYLQAASQNRDAADALGNSWAPGIPVNDGEEHDSTHRDMKRKSSPVLPVGRNLSMTSTRSETRTRDGDWTTHWGSVHSPVAPVDVQQSWQKPRTTYIQKDQKDQRDLAQDKVDQDAPAEVVTVMLDTSSEHSFDNRQSFYLEDDEESLSGIPTAANRFSGQFHHRIGEECPTFSARKESGRSRKMPPPTPLLLQGKGTNRAIVVQAAEPSPVESPEAAYQVIQEQLRRFDQANRESVESEGRRLALLEDLELEMGQLENKWQSSHNRLERDSVSTIQTATTRDSRPNSNVVPLSQGASVRSILAERRASRRARMQSGGSLRSKDEDNTGTPSSQDSSQSSESAHASLWQARLAEAQMEYMEHAPDLIMKRNNMNYLSVSKAALGSPSPPDTDDSESDSDIRGNMQSLDSRMFKPAVKPTVPIHELWKSEQPVLPPISAGLWATPVKISTNTVQSYDLPEPSIRPAARKSQGGLTITSSRLWQKPNWQLETAASKGLWRKYVPRPATRPVTIRPPRRNKRVNLLPDIVENPQPLPDKRGTLGIFQFPWGERSEHATIQYRPSQMFMAMPGTMTSGAPMLNAALAARARQVEASEYASSFFDEYEEEEEGDNFDDNYDGFDSEEDGDDFDETTLWEIASLLKSEQVPSKNSLLPPPYPSSPINTSVLAEYVTDMPSDEENDDDVPAGLEILEEPVPIERSPVLRSDQNSVRHLLWSANSDADNARHNGGLPQPDGMTWQSYLPKTTDVVRSRPRVEALTTIDSTSLWVSVDQQADSSRDELLWAAPKPVSAPVVHVVLTQPRVQSQASLLWEKPSAIPPSRTMGACGLSQPDEATWKNHAPERVDSIRSKPRTEENVLRIESACLWAPDVIAANAVISGLLWTSVKSTALLSTAQGHSQVAVDGPLLWVQPVLISPIQVDGLFDVHVPRLDYRRTSKQPAALTLSARAPRVTAEPLSPLTTSNLWGSKSLKVRTAFGIATGKSALWIQPVFDVAPQIGGLFDFKFSRVDHRRTSKEPAAFKISARAPRFVKEPLAQLTTTDLWAPKCSNLTRPSPMPGYLFQSSESQYSSEPKAIPRAAITPAQSHSMWRQPLILTEPAQDGLFDINVARPDFRRTSQFPAAIASVKKSPRKMLEPLPRYKTESLWTAKFQDPATMSSAHNWLLTPSKAVEKNRATKPAHFNEMWTKPAARQEPESQGLFDANAVRNDFRSTSQPPAAKVMASKTPRATVEPLVRFQKGGLWTVRSQSSSSESSSPSWLLVAARPLAPQMPPCEAASIVLIDGTAYTGGLWNKPMAHSESESEGVFNAEAVRHDFRRTSKLPAAISTTTKPRTVKQPAVTLTSKTLWVLQPHVSRASGASKISLWSKSVSVSSSSPGLFQLDPTRTVYRTTSADPAALAMLRKPRSIEQPMQRLQSTRLWVKSQVTSVELDWISIYSVRPSSPSIASMMSSAPSSPTADAASVKTTTTKASTVTTSSKSTGGFLGGWFGRKAKKTPDVPKVPEHAEIEMKTAELDELPEEFIIKNLDEIPRDKPVHIPIRQQHRPTIAYRESWGAALSEAIVASYPGTKLALRASHSKNWDAELQEAINASHIAPKIARSGATPREWSVALRCAITASYPELRFSRGQAPPSQWAAELQQAIVKSKLPDVGPFDVAVRHPVFFGSLETSAETVHPAMEGYGASAKPERSLRQTKHKQAISTRSRSATRGADAAPFVADIPAVPAVVSSLWVKPMPIQTAIHAPTGMWASSSDKTGVPQHGTLPEVECCIQAHHHTQKTSTKVHHSPDIELPSGFGKGGLWKRTTHKYTPREMNWLDDSTKRRFTRLELRY
ncbi:Uu.00g128570.m01.CDS01 [Anthostomella pinea]|uniref:Uu.00g128570.m01.CDS01 n=1 Tax=Anthostomella pinea TaxID=933095 RepID=A0AAI8VID2_9PEZI|nr:Uu.00g128570.m01.CDS01 [Anthostomella pinea]